MSTLRAALQRTGIRRTGGPRNGFRFVRADGAPVRNAERARLLALHIPPAWRDVVIARDPRARLQAVGRDRAGRWQYRYREQHARRRAHSKFARMVAFAGVLPRLRDAIRRDLALRGLPRPRSCAIALLLLMACPLRTGGRRYARENGTFGIATLRPAHVSVGGGVVTLSFRGKHGVRQRHTIASPRLARALAPLVRAGRRELFHYSSADGRVHDLTDEHLNAWLRQALGARFTAKDLRAWSATLRCASLLSEGSGEAAALAATARWLGNTPAVTRESYVHPRVLAAARQGRTLGATPVSPEALVERMPRRWHRAERALLCLLEAR